MTTVHAFTTYYNGITNKLINSTTLIYGGKEYKTQLAQWDTGATHTCISKNVVSQLGLTPIGQRPTQTPSGRKIVNEYRVDIKLQNENVLLKNIFVIDSEIGDQGIDVLIGMNIINLGDFSVSIFQGKTVFSFRAPSEGCTDYVKMINARTPITKGKKFLQMSFAHAVQERNIKNVVENKE